MAEKTDIAPGSKLEPFLDIIASGEVPHQKIAELAGVTVEDVVAFLASLEPASKPLLEQAPSPEAQAAPPADSSPPSPEVQPSASDSLEAWLAREEERLTRRAEQLAAWDLELSQREMALASQTSATQAASFQQESRASADSAPPTVRALRKARILDADGKLWYVRTRDVYSGAQAAFLWANHPTLVEAYNPPLSG